MPPASGYHASDGAAYERFLGRWTQRLAVPFIAFAQTPADGEALEVGCGTGNLAIALSERRRGNVVAVDIAEPYLAFARSRPGADRVRFQLGNAGQLPFADGHFAAAFAQLVLNFVPDADVAAREIRRVCRRGGTAAALVWDFRGGLVYQRLFWDTAAGVDPMAGPARDRLFSHPLALPDGLPDLWRRAGFAEIERGSITVRMDYASFEDYWDPLLGGQGPVGTYVTGLAPPLREQVRERVRAAYLSGQPDGPRSLTATAWAVRGTAP
ncbi:MAG: class I SAM-dependent methyltransferase [Alphaproteobacteria bacterium]|nr:class I SAM-dependent methyltransferase [Alphaproteobacteria bacterium]